jgi:hypothetical protein
MIKKLIFIPLAMILLAALTVPDRLRADPPPDFRPNDIQIDEVSSGPFPQKTPGDLFFWVQATFEDTTGYVLTEYVWAVTTSPNPPDDTELGLDAPNRVPFNTFALIVAEYDLFADSDGDSWYLHVKTVYRDDPLVAGSAVSPAFTSGPYTFDNVPPAAVLSVDTSVEGQTANTVLINPAVLKVNGPLADISTAYVNSVEQFSSAVPYRNSDIAGANDASFDSADGTFTYDVPEPGSVTLWAWFADAVGNVSDPVSLTFTSDINKIMIPAQDTTLMQGLVRVFSILNSGDTETFDWSIVDEDTGQPSTGASFAGDFEGAAVSVKGDTEGARVRVRAVSRQDAAEYESGIITIVERTQMLCLDVDGNGQVVAREDGFLILRYLFNIRNDTLISGTVVGSGADRSTAAEITAYLDAALDDLSLDVDGNGQVVAREDGFLILRYLFNIRNDTLISGTVVGSGADRSTAAEITAYLDAARCGL